jgi:hypothetical protein
MKKSRRTGAGGFALTLVVILAASGACNSNPTAPTTPSTPAATGGADLRLFHLSGVVTDEDGQPLPNAAVVINRYDVRLDGRPGYAVRWTETRTDGQGRYEMDFEALRNGYHSSWLQNVVAFGYAHVDTDGHEKDLQFFASSTSTVVGDFRLERRLRLAADGTATVTFRSDESICDGDASLNYEDLCRYVRITVPADGTLTVSASPSSGGATSPYLLVIEDPISGANACPCGRGTVSYPVRAGSESLVAINIPRASSQPRSYAVTTSFRAANK